MTGFFHMPKVLRDFKAAVSHKHFRSEDMY